MSKHKDENVAILPRQRCPKCGNYGDALSHLASCSPAPDPAAELAMTYCDWRKQYDDLSERDKKSYDLARKAVNALGFAMQNMHSDRIVEKREKESDDAMKALFDHLCTRSSEKEPKP